MPVIKLSQQIIDNQDLQCPDGKRRTEYCDKDLPTPIPEPVAMPVPVRHGGACRCDEKAKKIILDFIWPQIVLMTPGEECEAKDLFERECWGSLSHAECIGIGNCIVCLVAQGILPLENLSASPKSANHVVYRKL